jgi:hypothetical protein
VGFISQRSEELRINNLVKSLTISNPVLKSGIFKCIFWLDGSFLGGDDWGFLKEGVKIYLVAPMSPQLANFFSVFTTIVYNLNHSLSLL